MPEPFRFPSDQRSILDGILRAHLKPRDAARIRKSIENAIGREITRRGDGVRRVEYPLDPARHPGLMVYGAGIPDPNSVNREELKRLLKAVKGAFKKASPRTLHFVRGAFEHVVQRDSRRLCWSCMIALHVRLEALPEAITELLEAPLRGPVFEEDKDPEMAAWMRQYTAHTSNPIAASAASGVPVELEDGRKGRIVYKKVRKELKRGPKGKTARDRFIQTIVPHLPPTLAREQLSAVLLLCCAAAGHALPTSTADSGRIADGGMKHVLRKAVGTPKRISTKTR